MHTGADGSCAFVSASRSVHPCCFWLTPCANQPLRHTSGAPQPQGGNAQATTQTFSSSHLDRVPEENRLRAGLHTEARELHGAGAPEERPEAPARSPTPGRRGVMKCNVLREADLA